MAVLRITETDNSPFAGLVITDLDEDLQIAGEAKTILIVEQDTGLPGPPGEVGPAADLIMPWYRDGDAQVVVGTVPFRFPFTATILGVSASAVDAPEGADLILDINLDGDSIFSSPGDRPRILAGEHDCAEVSGTVPVSAGAWLTVDIDQVGSSAPGSGVSVYVRYRKE